MLNLPVFAHPQYHNFMVKDVNAFPQLQLPGNFGTLLSLGDSVAIFASHNDWLHSLDKKQHISDF